jgi:hypothetical protein
MISEITFFKIEKTRSWTTAADEGVKINKSVAAWCQLGKRARKPCQNISMSVTNELNRARYAVANTQAIRLGEH